MITSGIQVKDDAGSTTILAAGLAICMASVLVVIVALAQSSIDSHRVAVAAELAAVAAAYTHYYGNNGCAVAAEIAERNHGQLSDCYTTDMDITVTVSMRRHQYTATAGPL
ncbi:Rv3654c family TadE-like protein [Corynebacterium kutscheri]|uniref:Helicase/secretion neighborhood TadE-like protein n=1 Tax=Corynebacterium kutscheri TaxID=35755 RepID=A0A0F6R0H9_9CORY|nr:Rv3654c family TadE-like protein [Corynebacterium kutscheri]AKE40428.1 helicase/secretion neighborhood TadE-like protein [Corynebacterium kutscheri]VEH10823.1 putative secreted protein [Corynebacterium kutscheri]